MDFEPETSEYAAACVLLVILAIVVIVAIVDRIIRAA